MREPILKSKNPSTRLLTLAIVLSISLVAFDALAVVTIAPEITQQLQGRAAYSWLFSGFFLASILGTAIAGQQADRKGPNGTINWGLALFGLGLFLSGVATNMTTLLAGRALQGFGSGMLVTSLYVVINLAYDDASRSRIFALMSSAWIAPALIGPLAAGYIVTFTSWRVVFLALLPLVVVVAFAVRSGLPKSEVISAETENRLPAALRLVLGATLLLIAPSQANFWMTGPLAVIGLILGFSGLKPLLPERTLSLGRGLPTSIVVHGLVFAAFSTVEAYLALALTSVLNLTPLTAGIIIGCAAVTWSGGTWLQEKLDADISPHKRQGRTLVGEVLLLVGISLQIVALYSTSYALALSLIGWVTAGMGIGLAHTATLALVQRYTPEGEAGKTSSAMYLFEQLAFSLSVGAGGALLLLASQLQLGEREGVLSIFALCLLIAVFGLLITWRLTTRSIKAAA